MTDLRSSLIASIEQHDAEHRTADEIVLREEQQAYYLAPYQAHFEQGLLGLYAESQRVMNRSWERMRWLRNRRAFRQRFIRRYRR